MAGALRREADMNVWLVLAAVPVLFSTLVAVSACRLASQRDRAVEGILSSLIPSASDQAAPAPDGSETRWSENLVRV
jgi:hypothetical protein